MCISMELVTAVLGDHGQRPREDYGKMFLFLFFQLIAFGTKYVRSILYWAKLMH